MRIVTMRLANSRFNTRKIGSRPDAYTKIRLFADTPDVQNRTCAVFCCFLARFTEGQRWAHMDIAGVAFRDRELGADPRGATGYGVRTLVELATRLAAQNQARSLDA